jgi:aryl-alcohol dehydrogenase-like predicted oxidoreductase
METRILKGTELEVSRLCLGTMTFGAQADEAEARSMVDLCLERGVNFIDTANVYAGGASETILGKILKGRRDRVVLASKAGIAVGEEPHQKGLSRLALERQMEEILGRLQTDSLDLFYLHQPDYNTPLAETLDTIEELRERGTLRWLGASNYASWQMGDMRQLAESKGQPPVAVTQPMYNLVARGIEQEFLPMCQAKGLSVVAYNPLAGGLLTGKHKIDGSAAGTRFDEMPFYRDRYWNRDTFAAVECLQAIAAKVGRSLISLAFHWLLHHTSTDVIIVGASRTKQLEENLDVLADGKLDDDSVRACDEVWAALRGPAPVYNR